MCVLAVACGASERYRIVVAANRDERHDRPALAIHWWHDRTEIFGGRDLAASGSWLAVDRRGRFAAVTNVRSEQPAEAAPKSRGRLVAEFLSGDASAADYAAALAACRDEYAPFNLVLYDGGTLLVASNRTEGARLERGVFALSNAPLGTTWPKIAEARAGLEAALLQEHPTGPLLELLARRGAAPESSLFLPGETFGTRSSAVILIDMDGRLTFTERRFGPGGVAAGDSAHGFDLPR